MLTWFDFGDVYWIWLHAPEAVNALNVCIQTKNEGERERENASHFLMTLNEKTLRVPYPSTVDRIEHESN